MAKVYQYDNLYEQIISFRNLEYAFTQVTKGDRKFRKDAILFSMALDKNLVDLWHDLKRGNYRVGEYIRFKVYEPKERWVSAPRVRDKIVQFATHHIIKRIYENVFISDSYACLDGRGTHAAVNSVQRDMRIAEREFLDPWIVSVDVSKFFYSIDREILKQILRKKIKCAKTLWLLDRIIDSSPEGATGIPLGNVTSQDFANIYLNEMDQYVKRFLGVRYYTRYMDDMIAFVDGKFAAQSLKEEMCNFLEDRLNMVANPKKSQIFPLDQGVNAYGYKIWTTHKLVRDDSKCRAKRRIKAMDRKLQAGLIQQSEITQSVNSWLGHARHSDSYNLVKKIYAPYPYITIEGDERFGNR
ncbi:reverse transcriptase domain-containing protein [Sporosarcina sp. FSL W7-1283]|uniref:reverse transcriptase domain-containing protein n=1 Tax=Sporosarcina sp. FSL W7-1283 TaxID=2921560 RepID=UPI0030F657AB